jgi:hypothetical protein
MFSFQGLRERTERLIQHQLLGFDPLDPLRNDCDAGSKGHYTGLWLHFVCRTLPCRDRGLGTELTLGP